MSDSDKKYLKYQPNPIHYFDAYSDSSKSVVNAVIEINSKKINKYEVNNISGIIHLDRVGYSSLAYPFVYGGIPGTWDQDGDPLDIEIVNVSEEILAGSMVRARIIGVMEFEDGGEVDDKIIAVLADDKRSDHILTVEDLGEHFIKETKYYWEHYKDLKKPGTCIVKGFGDANRAVEIVDECIQRYKTDILPFVE